MPVGFMRLRTATPPQLEQYHDDPKGLETFVKQVIEGAEPEAKLVSLYFDVSGEYAYALITDLDDPINIKSVTRHLGADSHIKLITVDQAVEAIDRQKRLPPSSGTASK
jgi:hypothetical protein